MFDAHSLNICIMSPTLRLLVLATTIASVSLTTQKVDNRPGCQEFGKDSTFKDNQAVGNWHLLHQGAGAEKSGTEGSQCVQFSLVSDQERKDLSNHIEKVVDNLKWENLVLKMQIPCSIMKSNKTRVYYLEKQEGQGSYRTLQMPASGAKINAVEIDLHPMRLKVIQDQYLGMMDCYAKFLFLLGKEHPNSKEVDGRLKKMMEPYWLHRRK